MPVDATAPELRKQAVRNHQQQLTAFYDRHQAIFERVGDVNVEVWSARAQDLIFVNGKDVAVAFGRLVFNQLERSGRPYEARFRPDLLDPYLQETSQSIGATHIAVIAEELEQLEPDEVFDARRDRAGIFATSLVTSFANFGANDGAKAAGAAAKTWQVTSGNPRSSHAALNGQSVPVDGTFSNGLRWPGDRSGSAEQTAGCKCTMTFTRRR